MNSATFVCLLLTLIATSMPAKALEKYHSGPITHDEASQPLVILKLSDVSYVLPNIIEEPPNGQQHFSLLLLQQQQVLQQQQQKLILQLHQNQMQLQEKLEPLSQEQQQEQSNPAEDSDANAHSVVIKELSASPLLAHKFDTPMERSHRYPRNHHHHHGHNHHENDFNRYNHHHYRPWPQQQPYYPPNPFYDNFDDGSRPSYYSHTHYPYYSPYNDRSNSYDYAYPQGSATR